MFCFNFSFLTRKRTISSIPKKTPNKEIGTPFILEKSDNAAVSQLKIPEKLQKDEEELIVCG
jgi:hypothetical protein